MNRRTFLALSGAGLASGLGTRHLGNQVKLSGEAGSPDVLSYDIGMGQMLVEGGAVRENLDKAVAMISQAAEKGCRLVLLPECLDCGWTYPDSPRLADPIPGPHTDILAKAAKANDIYVVAGLTERAGPDTYNSAVLISPENGILLKHRKINILTIAQDIYSIGDRLGVAHTPLGTIGINICADNFPDSLVLGHSLARMGAQIILSPSAWAVDADHDNKQNPYGGGWRRSFTELATLYDLTVISVSNVGWIHAGVWKGRKCIGCSMAVGAGGKSLADCPYGETAEHLGIAKVELTPRKVKGTAISGMLKEKGHKI
ncbi:MAG: carbon-nitrogen hydrolase family protein [Candidatus Aminicenantes bacterium]|nr:carbon-nitrogen hydrolase family protein [Candidatus Aminicenantes bacterium]